MRKKAMLVLNTQERDRLKGWHEVNALLPSYFGSRRAQRLRNR
jgi:hypothetical protein